MLALSALEQYLTIHLSAQFISLGKTISFCTVTIFSVVYFLSFTLLSKINLNTSSHKQISEFIPHLMLIYKVMLDDYTIVLMSV